MTELQTKTQNQGPPSSGRSKLTTFLTFALLALSAGPAATQSGASADPRLEYKVKAAYLYNFAKFVEWPAHAFKGPADPIVFAVLGKDPFGDVLESTFENKTIGGRPCTVKRFSTLEEVKDCHVLFLGSSLDKEIAKAIPFLKGKPTVTVGEAESFTSVGGMIRLFLKENKVHFEINIDSAKAEGIKVSSQLLKLGKVVGDKANSAGK